MKLKSTLLISIVTANVLYSYGAVALRLPKELPLNPKKINVLPVYPINLPDIYKDWTKFLPCLEKKIYLGAVPDPSLCISQQQPFYRIIEFAKFGAFQVKENDNDNDKASLYAILKSYQYYNNLPEFEKRLALHFKIDPNQNLMVLCWYADGYDQSIDSLWGIQFGDKQYCAVWIQDPNNNQQELLVDGNQKTIAIKDKSGKIIFESERYIPLKVPKIESVGPEITNQLHGGIDDLQKNWAKFFLKNKSFQPASINGIQLFPNMYAIGFLSDKFTFVTVSEENLYYKHCFSEVIKKYNTLSDHEYKLVKYLNNNINQNIDIKFWYADGYDQNIDSLWGIQINDKKYCTVWVQDPNDDKQKLLIDENRKIIATKSVDGKITIDRSIY